MNFKELPAPTLSADDRERIMSHVLEAAARRERLSRVALYTVATLIFAAAIVWLVPSFEMPKLEISPLYIVIAGCTLLLLVVNDLILRRTNSHTFDSREPCAQ